MSKTYTTLSREGYTYLCSIIKQVVSLPTDVIDNLNLATNTTYSSIKIKTIVDKTLEDAKEYANEVCAALVKLECRKTTTQPTLENSDINVIYLYSADGNAPFQQYLKISETELVDMGSTNINLDGYLTATEITRDYVTKLDFNTLKTEVEGKVDKADIVNNLTSTDADKPLSANQGKVLKDEVNLKANDSDLTTHTSDIDIHITTTERTKWNEVDNKVNKTDLDVLKQGILVTGTSSMNKNILLWDVGHYYFNLNSTWKGYEHIPNTDYAPHVYVTSVKPVKYEDTNNEGTWFRQIKVDDHLGKSFIRTIYTTDINNVVNLENGKLISSGSDTGWQRVCTTAVADKTFDATSLTSLNSNYTFLAIKGVVKNGFCTCTIGIKVVNPVLTYEDVASGMPNAQVPYYVPPMLNWSDVSGLDTTSPLHITISTDGLIRCEGGVASKEYYVTVTYPVAES